MIALRAVSPIAVDHSECDPTFPATLCAECLALWAESPIPFPAKAVNPLAFLLCKLRRQRGLSQKAAARLSRVGEKTISSFETGERIGSLKVLQLQRMLKVYGVSEADFFLRVAALIESERNR